MSALPRGVTRLGSRYVNWYVIAEEGRATVVDAGVAGYRRQLGPPLEGQVAAVVLTHAHADHVGVAELLRTELGVPVYVHEADAELARTAKRQGKNEASMLSALPHPAVWRLLIELLRNGGAKPRPIRELQTFADGDELDVPGRLCVLHTPGHTAGHCALLADGPAVLFAGDAICSLNPVTGATGPQLMPNAFTRDVEQALASLDRLADPRASVLLPGHGDPIADLAAAVEQAKRRGPT